MRPTLADEATTTFEGGKKDEPNMCLFPAMYPGCPMPIGQDGMFAPRDLLQWTDTILCCCTKITSITPSLPGMAASCLPCSDSGPPLGVL